MRSPRAFPGDCTSGTNRANSGPGMPRNIVHAFIDTNVIIHGLPLDQIDWLDVLDTKAASLLLSSTVIGEIDKLKLGRQGRFARDRARAFGEQFRKWEESAFTATGARIQKGVHLRAFALEPHVGKYADLDPTVADDRIIAAMLEYERAARGAPLVIVAVDTLILAKSKAHGLSALRLPAKLERPLESDETEVALKKAQQDLANERFRRPRVSAQLRTAKEVGGVVSVELLRMAIPSDAEISRMGDVERNRMGLTERIKGLRGRNDPDAGHVELYGSRYEEFLRELARVEATRRRTFRLALCLVNDGTAMASNVEVDVKVRNGVELAQHVDTAGLLWPTPPQLFNMQPRIRPGQQGEDIDHWLEGDCAPLPFNVRTQLRYRAGDLLQESPRDMRGFLVTLPEDFEQEGFEVGISVRAKELPKQQESVLNVKVAMEDGGRALTRFLRE